MTSPKTIDKNKLTGWRIKNKVFPIVTRQLNCLFCWKQMKSSTVSEANLPWLVVSQVSSRPSLDFYPWWVFFSSNANSQGSFPVTMRRITWSSKTRFINTFCPLLRRRSIVTSRGNLTALRLKLSNSINKSCFAAIVKSLKMRKKLRSKTNRTIQSQELVHLIS